MPTHRSNHIWKIINQPARPEGDSMSIVNAIRQRIRAVIVPLETRLVADWSFVLAHSWSIRIIAAAVVMSIVEGVASLAGELYGLPFWLHAAIVSLTPLIIFAAGLARLMAQRVFDKFLGGPDAD
jgi:hypothetical protein